MIMHNAIIRHGHHSGPETHIGIYLQEASNSAEKAIDLDQFICPDALGLLYTFGIPLDKP